MKNGVILCGGNGTRLKPATDTTNKALLKVNGRCIVDYPLKTLKDMGVENVSVVLGGQFYGQIVEYLKDGADFGMNFSYVFQREPKGIAQAINLCKHQLSNTNQFVVILADNIFEKPIQWSDKKVGAQIVLDYDKCNQESIKRFGVATVAGYRNHNYLIRLEEKPRQLPSWNDPDIKARWMLGSADIVNNYPITGCYVFDSMYWELFQLLKPSARNEFEILDILEFYHSADRLTTIWHKDGLWIDVGTHESLKAANEYFVEKKPQ